MMISFLEVAERARSGLRMDDKEWEVIPFKKLQDPTTRRNLKQSPERFCETEYGLELVVGVLWASR